jgi:hypothetical protein
MRSATARFVVAVSGLLAVPFVAAAREPTGPPGLTAVDIVIADPDATGYATFQSHNQKLVSNAYGWFMTHLRTRNEPYTAQTWRLSRSTDGGATWQSVYEATDATSAPAMETTADGTLYLARPDFTSRNAYLYRFRLSDDDPFTSPEITVIPEASAGKYCLMLDPPREQLYYFSHNGRFSILGLDPAVKHQTTLLGRGENAGLQYPLLHLGVDGVLYAGWTTQKHGLYMYWDMHAMQSRDGGRSWQRLDGVALTPPIIADDGGPAERITFDDEYDAHTWMSSLLAKDGKLHFAYLAQSPIWREHYVRYDLATGREDLRMQPAFRGERLSMYLSSGVFVTRASLPDAPLYYVSRNKTDDRIACLASDDNGRTWYDYAVSDQPRTPYALGGCRELTADGMIIGSFTERMPDDTSDTMHPARVCFLKIQAGLSTVNVTHARHADGQVTLRFDAVRGQPEAIRLRSGEAAWGPWHPFKAELRIPSASRPTGFQLRSRLGVISAVYDLASE